LIFMACLSFIRQPFTFWLKRFLNQRSNHFTSTSFLNIFWCDLPLLAVFIIFVLFLPSSGP
jgi:hypothetical protein